MEIRGLDDFGATVAWVKTEPHGDGYIMHILAPVGDSPSMLFNTKEGADKYGRGLAAQWKASGLTIEELETEHGTRLGKIDWHPYEAVRTLDCRIVTDMGHRNLLSYRTKGIPPLTEDAEIYFLHWIDGDDGERQWVSAGIPNHGDANMMFVLWVKGYLA